MYHPFWREGSVGSADFDSIDLSLAGEAQRRVSWILKKELKLLVSQALHFLRESFVTPPEGRRWDILSRIAHEAASL